MTKWTRFFSAVVLSSFFFFVTVQAFHGHKELKDDGNCSICQMVHHAPALVSGASHADTTMIVADAATLVIPHPYLQFVFPSHGLSPPTL